MHDDELYVAPASSRLLRSLRVRTVWGVGVFTSVFTGRALFNCRADAGGGCEAEDCESSSKEVSGQRCRSWSSFRASESLLPEPSLSVDGLLAALAAPRDHDARSSLIEM